MGAEDCSRTYRHEESPAPAIFGKVPEGLLTPPTSSHKTSEDDPSAL